MKKFIMLILLIPISCFASEIDRIKKDIEILQEQVRIEKQSLEVLAKITEKAQKHAEKFMTYNDKLLYKDAVKYGIYVEKYAKKYKIDPNLIVSIIIIESHANHRAKSRVGAIGLMQIYYNVWAKELNKTKEELFDPEQNIKYGTYILKYYIDKYDGNIMDAVMAYNTGSRKKINHNYTTKVFSLYFNFKDK